jgi:Fe-S oxidoreductase/FAD/FMN-containing dehydrogenase
LNEQESERDLRAIVGERATVSPHERWYYRSDILPIPRWLENRVKSLPDAVVAPVNVREVSTLLEYCSANTIPVTPRGAGSSGLFGAVPKKAGVVFDLRGLEDEISIERDKLTVTCGAGMTWWELEKQLAREGLTLMSYPSSARSATLAGWIATTGLGIGNIRYGPVADQVLSAKIALADGTVREYSNRGDLDPFMGSEGLLGIVTSLSLKVRPVAESVGRYLVYFNRIAALFEFLEGLMKSSPLPYAVEFFDDGYLAMLKSAGYRVTDYQAGSGLVLLAFEGTRQETAEAATSLHSLLKACSGEERTGAEEEWRNRFNMLRVRRAVPSLIPGSVYVPLSRSSDFYSRMIRLTKRRIALLGHVVSKEECALMPMIPTDRQGSIEHTLSLSTPPELSNLALTLGGKPGGGLGLWNAAYRNSPPMKQKAAQIENMKGTLDPKGILNPGMWQDPPWLLKSHVFFPAVSAASEIDWVLPGGHNPEKREPNSEFSDCVQCGYCMGYCPTRQRWLSSTPRGRILAARELLHPGIEKSHALDHDVVNDIFECTLCGRCKVDCSVDIKSPEMWADLRAEIAKAGQGLDSLKVLASMVDDSHNLAAKPNEQRGRWAERLKLTHLKEKAETLYFVGCVTSFYPMVQDVARSFARILDNVGEDFSILGGDEWCCGYPLLSAGEHDSAVKHIAANIAKAKGLGVKRIVTACPGCYRMWKHDYPRLTGEVVPFEVLHSTQVLDELVMQKRIAFSEAKMRITYHDPCDLGRNAGIYDQPRRIISSIPGLEFIELESNREYCNCCGSGGDLLASNQQLSLNIAARKVQEVLDTGAESLVTACPSCIRAITMAKLAEKAQFNLMDISHLVWNAMVK